MAGLQPPVESEAVPPTNNNIYLSQEERQGKTMTLNNVPRARSKLPKAGAPTSATANQVCLFFGCAHRSWIAYTWCRAWLKADKSPSPPCPLVICCCVGSASLPVLRAHESCGCGGHHDVAKNV